MNDLIRLKCKVCGESVPFFIYYPTHGHMDKTEVIEEFINEHLLLCGDDGNTLPKGEELPFEFKTFEDYDATDEDIIKEIES